MLSHLWGRLQKGRGERRTAEARTRFWAEVREGQREAEAHSPRLSELPIRKDDPGSELRKDGGIGDSGARTR